MILLVILSIYFLNVINLFETQSIIHFFCFWLFFIIIERQISKLDFSSLILQYYDWVYLMRFFAMLKIWHMLIIRSYDIKMAKFLSFFLRMIRTLRSWLSLFNTVYKFKYYRKVRQCTEYIFERLRLRIRILKSTCRQSNKNSILLHLNIIR